MDTDKFKVARQGHGAMHPASNPGMLATQRRDPGAASTMDQHQQSAAGDLTEGIKETQPPYLQGLWQARAQSAPARKNDILVHVLLDDVRGAPADALGNGLPSNKPPTGMTQNHRLISTAAPKPLPFPNATRAIKIRSVSLTSSIPSRPRPTSSASDRFLRTATMSEPPGLLASSGAAP